MAAVVGNVAVVSSGIPKLVYATITMDDSYATSGEAVVARDFGLIGIKSMFLANADGRAVKAVRTSDTAWLVKVFATSDATTSVGVPVETASATDLSATIVSALVVGT